MSDLGGFIAGSVVAKLLLDKSGWDKAIRDIEGGKGSLLGITKGIGEGFIQIGKMAAIAGAAAAGALAVMIKKTADAGEKLYEMSKKTGVSVEVLSGYRLAAEKAGSSLEGLAIGIRFLSRNMYDASRGAQTARASFQELGISTAGWAGQLPPINAMLLTIADRFAGMEDGAKKSALAIKIFGRSGTELIPFLNLGSEGLREEAALAEKLGVVFTTKTAAAAHEFSHTLVDLRGGLDGIRNTIGNALIPVVNTLGQNLVEALETMNGKIKEFASSGLLEKWAKETATIFVWCFKQMVRAVEGLLLLLPTIKAGIGTGLAWTQDVLGGIYEKLAKLGPDEGLNKKMHAFFADLAAGARGAATAFREGADENVEKASDIVEGFDAILAGLDGLITGFGKTGEAGKKAGAKIATAFGPDLSLKAKLGLTFFSDVEEKIADVNKALKDYASLLTPESARKLTDELEVLTNKFYYLKSSLDITFNYEVQKHIDDIKKAMSEFQGTMNPETVRRLALEIDHLSDSTDYLRTELSLTFTSDVSRKIDDIVLALKKYSEAAGDAKRTLTPEDVRKLELQLERLENPLAFIKEELGITFTVDIKRKIGDITLALQAFRAQMTPDQIIALEDALKDLWAQLGVFAIKWGDFFGGLKTGFSSLFEGIINGTKKLSQFWSGFWQEIKKAFAKVLAEMVAGYVTNFVKQILVKTGLLKAIDNIVGGILGGLFGGAGSAVGGSLAGGLGGMALGGGAALAGGAAGSTASWAPWILGSTAGAGAALTGQALLWTAPAAGAGLAGFLSAWAGPIAFGAIFLGTLFGQLFGKSAFSKIYAAWDQHEKDLWDRAVREGTLLGTVTRNILQAPQPGAPVPANAPRIGSLQPEGPAESLWSILGRKTGISGSTPVTGGTIINPVRVGGGETITVNVNLNGQVIADRDFVRNRMMPELEKAITSNVFRQKLQLALGVGR